MENFRTYYSAVTQQLKAIEREVLRYRSELNLSLLETVRLNNKLGGMLDYETATAETLPLGPSPDLKAVLGANINNLKKFSQTICVRLADHGMIIDLLRSDAINAHHHYQSDFNDIICFSRTRELILKMDELCKIISSILC